jgi:phage-related minor tail protein
MPSELLPSGGGIGGWFSSLFGGNGGGNPGGGAANDNSLIKAGTDLTSAASKLGSDAASKLAGAASSLGGVKDLLGSTTTASMNVQASTVNVVGGGSGTPGLGGIGSLFGGGTDTASGVDGVTASTYSSGVSDAAVNLADGYALGGIFSSGNVIPFANGGAFQGSGVYSSPSYFPMAGGRTGMLGEAGPEAVMPLVRGPSGSLGVKAHGGGGSPTPQVVNSGSTIHNEQHFHGDMSQEGMNRARRTSSQMSRDILEHAQRKALRFGS